MDLDNLQKTNFGLLKFCLEHSDDPAALTNTDLASFDRDPADYEFLMSALSNLESDFEKAKKLIDQLSVTDDIFTIKGCLEGLQYYCEDLDVSKSLIKTSGMETLLKYFDHSDASVRLITAWTLATMLMSNSTTQIYASKINILEKIVPVVVNESNDEVLCKQIYALSGFISQNPTAIQQFLSEFNGLQFSCNLIKTHSPSSPVQVKALWFFDKLVTLGMSTQLQIDSETFSKLILILNSENLQATIRKPLISVIFHLLHDPPESILKIFKESHGALLQKFDELSDDEIEHLSVITTKLNK